MQLLRENTKIKEFLAKIEASPKPPTEESILLRVLVQVMVMVGIIATDVASQSMNPMSIWAIPLSIIGAVISWRRRKQKNTALKFTLAMAMIVTLVIFLGNIFQNLNDTRLVLAEFLVQLQVLHSFDLPRRKDLGYSMIIGLVLIGVSATLSQTIAFAPWLLLLLLLGIPTLVLDYRSRIYLTPWENNFKSLKKETNTIRKRHFWQNSPLSPRRLFSFSLIILILGLFIFAVMPRYPGYQIQSFPVNAPEGFENMDFRGGDRSVVNPGFNPDGTPRGGIMGEGEGGGGSDEELFYYGFNTRINQNLTSTISRRRIVLRVRSQAPGFWRVLSFDNYTGQGWEISREDQTIDINRNFWNYQFNLSYPSIAGETKRIIQTYTVVRNLPNIIPNLMYPQYLYFPAAQVALDTEGGLRAPAGLIEGLTYTVVSRVPYRSQGQLQQAGNIYPQSISNYYLNISPEIKETVKKKAEALLLKAGRELPSNYDKALFLAQAIKQNYEVKTDMGLLAEGEDLVMAFLERGGGFPDQFATVYTMMLRALDIPSRFTVGFASGQFNPFTGFYVVHNTDAHALTEVYFPSYGWFYFDPLPGHEIIPPSFEDDNPFGVLGVIWRWVASWLPSPIVAFITILFENIFNAITSFLTQGWLRQLWRFLTGGLVGILIGVLGLIFTTFLGWLAWLNIGKFIRKQKLAKLPPMAKVYLEMLDLLKEKGYPKHPAQTPKEYANSLREFLLPEQIEIVFLITDSYVQWRYGGINPPPEYVRSQYDLLKKTLNRELGGILK